jgi:hypothetical protein
MKKLIIVSMMVILSTGCAVSSAKWSDGEELCASFGGVKAVPVHLSFVECKAGVYIQRVK